MGLMMIFPQFKVKDARLDDVDLNVIEGETDYRRFNIKQYLEPDNYRETLPGNFRSN